ncbi:ABC transporter ATP-binding protein [Bacillota bacterium Meth-B3]
MRSLWKFLRPYKKESILGPLFKLLEAGFELFVPLVVAAIVDRGIGGRDGALVGRYGMLLVALGVVGMVSAITAQYFAAKAAAGFATGVRRALLDRIQGMSYAQLDQAGTDTLIARQTHDVGQVQTGVNLTLRLFLRSPAIVLGAAIMAFTIDARAALVFVAAIPLLSLIVFGIMAYTIPLYRKVQNGLDRLLSLTRENLTGVRVIRAFHREDAEIDEFDARNRRLSEAQRFAGRISALMNPATYLVLNGGLIVLLWTGAARVDAGAISQGAVIALVNYLLQILVELVKLASLIVSVTRAMACWSRVEDVLRTPRGEGPGGTAPPAALALAHVSFENVSMRYPGALAQALTGATLSVPRGQTVGVIGGTGSGKTTLVNLIPRFYEATEGTVAVDGVDVRDWPVGELRARVGVVPQRAELFAGTIRENLRWGKADATDEALWHALEQAQARAFVEALPEGLNTKVAQRGLNLSGGQKQRLTIARALIRRPEILILDDSASALDYATDAALRRALRGLSGTTVFIVSQRAASVMHADQIAVLDDGRVVAVGAHDELLKSCAVYQEIYHSQFPKEAS